MSGRVYPMPRLYRGTILRRYQRFLADVQLARGGIITAHCPNTGAMTACWKPGAPAQLSRSENPGRKFPYTLERVDMGGGWIGVNTVRVNHIIAHALTHGRIPQLAGYREMRREVVFHSPGMAPARFDFCLRGKNRADAFVEVKNATLLVGDSVQFPDAVTGRGRKHLQLLMRARKLGRRAVVLFAVNRPEGGHFTPARAIDPEYADTLEQAAAMGVEIIALRLRHTARGVECVSR